jgi:hypothetical protein
MPVEGLVVAFMNFFAIVLTILLVLVMVCVLYIWFIWLIWFLSCGNCGKFTQIALKCLNFNVVFKDDDSRQESSHQSVMDLNDQPPSYPQIIIDDTLNQNSNLLHSTTIFNQTIELPPPNYDEWFKDRIFQFTIKKS